MFTKKFGAEHDGNGAEHEQHQRRADWFPSSFGGKEIEQSNQNVQKVADEGEGHHVPIDGAGDGVHVEDDCVGDHREAEPAK